jgi:DNA-binding NtrC family response regulator
MADTLLLVADDQRSLESLGAHFERHGYEVLRESGSEAAVATFRERRPDVVLLDLPADARGLGLLAQLRQENASVILLARVREAPRAPLDRRHQAHTLSEVERQHIERTLRHHGGNRTRAALELGISRATLINKIKAYSLNL